MSLDYLMKKVWHPGSMKNIQKVWEEEQKQRELMRKAEEMKKKLVEERHYNEIRRLQVQAGQLPASQLERLDWIYEFKGNHEKTAEEYLMGKKLTEDGKPKETKFVSKEQITNQLCEDFFKVHEDPLFLIKSEEVKARKAVENNPMKMKQIYESVEYKPVIKERRKSSESRSDSQSSKRDRKGKRKHKDIKEKKEKRDRKEKKEKKEKKHRKHRRSRSRLSSSSDRSARRDKSLEHVQKPENRERSREDKYKSEKLKQQRTAYNQLLRQKYGSIAEQGDDGKVRLNFNKYRGKYKTQHQVSEIEKREARDKMLVTGRQVSDETYN